jgi:gliding motility-associated-like protein
LLCGLLSYAQDTCPLMSSPANNDINVSVDTSISWNAVSGAFGYFLLVGTTPGGRDLVDRINVGNTTTYTPPNGLPENTVIYVKVTVDFQNDFDMTCPTRNFTTGFANTIPNCTELISPLSGTADVSSTTTLVWKATSGVAGYRVSIGEALSNNNVLNEVVFSTNTTGEINLPANSNLNITITPFNSLGSALACNQESFTTTALECDHFVNPVDDFFKCDRDDDHFEEFNINLPELESQLIGNQTGLMVTYHNAGGDLIDFSPGTQFVVNQRTILARVTNAEGCYKETSFKLTLLSPPTASIIEDVIECESFTLPSIESYSNYFTGIRGSGNQLRSGDKITSTQTIFIYAVQADCSDESSFNVTIDPSFCREPEEEVTIEFPLFFTPNGDGINDFWHCSISEEKQRTTLKTIDIFDRYGNLLAKLSPESQGWDGNFKGHPQPSSDYWFQAISVNKKEIRGHFSLKR